MDSLLLASLLVANANTLPYQITEIVTGIKILAFFDRLTEKDALELQSQVWATAKFHDVWLAWLEEEHTFKLIVSHDLEKRVQGIVHLGEVKRAEFVGMTLRDNLLESAPLNRQQSPKRMYSGVGNALVARMIVESFQQGAKGQLLVRPIDGSLAFYQHVGFQQVRHTKYYVLSATNAQYWIKHYFNL